MVFFIIKNDGPFFSRDLSTRMMMAEEEVEEEENNVDDKEEEEELMQVYLTIDVISNIPGGHTKQAYPQNNADRQTALN